MMQPSIESRELFSVETPGQQLRCTYHKPYAAQSSALEDQQEGKRLGVLFLSPLAAPRAWSGDLAVWLADSFAASGYPAFRIDLPGLGDSTGEEPADLLDMVNSGEYASVTSASIETILHRFHLSGVVLVGHCSGAVTAIYTAAAQKKCKGLILMDPYFYSAKGLSPKMRLGLADWSSRSRLVALLRVLFDRARSLQRRMRSSVLPRNANFALLHRWKRVAARQVPVLVLKSPGIETPGIRLRPGQFAYLNYILTLAGLSHRVSLVFLRDTDHSFANDAGREAVQQHAMSWLHQYFPLVLAEDLVGSYENAEQVAEAGRSLSLR